MKTIASFSVDHRGMEPGVYFREDVRAGVPVLTADLRFFRPNAGRYLTTTEAHTVEHMLATCLRSSACADNIVYFGPMGCRTGFYLLLTGDYASKDVVPLVLDCFRFIRDYRGEVPGASPKDCGNYLDMNLSMANYWGRKYAALLENIDDNRLVYPE